MEKKSSKPRTFSEALAQLKDGRAKPRKKPADEEHQLQATCVRWFRLKYPHLHGRLFAVPNGGRRDPTTGAKLKAEGVIAGVADLIFLKPNSRYGALLIEMKTPTGTLRESQQRWRDTLGDDYKYVVCRSFDDFQREIQDYLNQ